MPISREGFEIKTRISLPPDLMRLGDREVVGPLLEVVSDTHVNAHWDQVRTISRKLEAMGFRALVKGPEVVSLPDGTTKMHSTIVPVKA